LWVSRGMRSEGCQERRMGGWGEVRVRWFKSGASQCYVLRGYAAPHIAA
jgi:hypothetical protein